MIVGSRKEFKVERRCVEGPSACKLQQRRLLNDKVSIRTCDREERNSRRNRSGKSCNFPSKLTCCTNRCKDTQKILREDGMLGMGVEEGKCMRKDGARDIEAGRVTKEGYEANLQGRN